MTPTELASLEALAKAATPGPWETSGVTREFGDVRFMFINKDGLGEICRLPLPDRSPKGYAPTICDQRYIAAANPAAILSLIEEYERMREALAAIVDCYGVGYKTEAQFCEAVRPLIADARAALEPQS